MMLNLLRSITKTWVGKIIGVFLIIGLAGFDDGAVLRSGEEGFAGVHREPAFAGTFHVALRAVLAQDRDDLVGEVDFGTGGGGEGEDEAEGAERHGNGVGNADYAESGPDFPDGKVRRMIRQFGESSSRIGYGRESEAMIPGWRAGVPAGRIWLFMAGRGTRLVPA